MHPSGNTLALHRRRWTKGLAVCLQIHKPNGQRILRYAQSSRKWPCRFVKCLLNHAKDGVSDIHDAKLRAALREALRTAAADGHVAVVNVLLDDNRVDPAASNSEALQRATINGHIDVVRALLRDGRVDPTVNKRKYISKALKNGHSDVVCLLTTDPMDIL